LFSSIPSQYHIYLGIGGLTFLMLFMSTLAQKFQAYQLEKEAALRRIVKGLKQVEHVLTLLDGCAVPKKIQILLRKEVLARYLAIRQIHKSFNNISLSIQSAQRGLQGAEAKGESRRVSISDSALFVRYIRGLSELISFLNSQGHIAGMSETERSQVLSELGNLRADYIYDFHVEAAKKLAADGAWEDANKELRKILQFLQTHGPSNDHVRNLSQQTHNYSRQVTVQQIPGSVPQTGSSYMEEPDADKPNGTNTGDEVIDETSGIN